MTRAVLLAALMLGCSGSGDQAPAAIDWHTDEDTAFAQARAEGKGVFIDIRSQWCSACDELETKTFSDPRVAAFIDRHYVALKLDVTAATEADEALQARYDADTLPAVRFVSPDGTVRARIDEFVAADAFMATASTTVAAR